MPDCNDNNCAELIYEVIIFIFLDDFFAPNKKNYYNQDNFIMKFHVMVVRIDNLKTGKKIN